MLYIPRLSASHERLPKSSLCLEFLLPWWCQICRLPFRIGSSLRTLQVQRAPLLRLLCRMKLQEYFGGRVQRKVATLGFWQKPRHLQGSLRLVRSLPLWMPRSLLRRNQLGYAMTFLKFVEVPPAYLTTWPRKVWVVGPCLDLDQSPHFDLSSLTLFRWLLHLVESGSLDSFFIQPPCTTFSPAAYPALRSYAKPRGYRPDEPRTLLGTNLALNSLALMLVASRSTVIGLLEQSRRSKMAWLTEWRWLVDSGLCSEAWLASCMYGSPHQKEFRLLGGNIEMARLHRACDRSHSHVVIQGKYTKPSATYTHELAEAFATEISRALRTKKAVDSYHQIDSVGLESPLFNDEPLEDVPGLEVEEAETHQYTRECGGAEVAAEWSKR